MTTTSAVAILKVLEKNEDSALELLDMSVSTFVVIISLLGGMTYVFWTAKTAVSPLDLLSSNWGRGSFYLYWYAFSLTIMFSIHSSQSVPMYRQALDSVVEIRDLHPKFKFLYGGIIESNKAFGKNTRLKDSSKANYSLLNHKFPKFMYFRNVLSTCNSKLS